MPARRRVRHNRRARKMSNCDNTLILPSLIVMTIEHSLSISEILILMNFSCQQERKAFSRMVDGSGQFC
jgi:hypothetical protein